MAEPIENKVTRSLKAAEELYHRLVLIVGKGGSGKTSVVQNLAKLHDAEPININLRLSKELLELTEKQRQLKLAELEAKYDGQFRVVFEALNELMAEPEPKRKPIGFSVKERRARYVAKARS